MYTETKATFIRLNSDEQKQLSEAVDAAGTDSEGNPVIAVYNEDDDLLGSVVFHADTEANELID